MHRCTQCGARLAPGEAEVLPRCLFCGTRFLPGAAEPDRWLVPASLSAVDVRRAIGDHLARAGKDGEAILEEPRIYYLPFRRRADGTLRRGFETQVPELRRFRIAGADWKPFDARLLAPGDALVEPSFRNATAPGEAWVHYPLARATRRTADDEEVFWVDAWSGRMVAAPGGDPGPRATNPLPPAPVAAAAAVYAALFLLLPLPWSLAAAVAASPALLALWRRSIQRTP